MKPLTFEQVKVGITVFIGKNYCPCKIVYISKEEDCRFPIFVAHPDGRVYSYAKDCVSSPEVQGKLSKAEKYDQFVPRVRDIIRGSDFGGVVGWWYSGHQNEIECGDHLMMMISELAAELKTIQKEMEETLA